MCPVLACCSQPPNLVVVSQLMPYGSLYNVLHEQTGIVVDQAQALKFAIDVARGVAFLHALDPLVLRYYLNSKHVVVDEDLSAKINMADTKFSFQERGRFYSPAWMAPEGDLILLSFLGLVILYSKLVRSNCSQKKYPSPLPRYGKAAAVVIRTVALFGLKYNRALGVASLLTFCLL